MAQQSLVAAKPGAQETHAPVKTMPGKTCGTKVLLRSKKDPRRRVWQCTDKQRELFRDRHATALMDELERSKGRPMPINQRRREHPSIQKLHDEGLVRLEPNPKSHLYEHSAHLTADGREWLKMQRTQRQRKNASRQESLFKGRVVLLVDAATIEPMAKDCGCDAEKDEAEEELPIVSLRKARIIGTSMQKAVLALPATIPDAPPPVDSWDEGPYTCEYVTNGRIGTLIIRGGGLRVPFTMLAKAASARDDAREACRALAKGLPPERGLFVQQAAR